MHEQLRYKEINLLYVLDYGKHSIIYTQFLPRDLKQLLCFLTNLK